MLTRSLLLASAVLSTFALAHEPDGGDDDDDHLDGGVFHVVVPPSIRTTKEAVWPTGEFGRDVHVHLELQIDPTGRVIDVHVIESGGVRFDEAAIAAVSEYTFSPATEDGVPVRSFVTYTYVFRAPPDAPDAGAAVKFGTTVVAQRPISASSSFSVRDRDFALRPIGSVQDILRVTPGLVVVQHSGGGKANQYFLRGFDADHGTDVALSIDGVPINMVSHGHGQGYADTNFIIPEVVERVEVTKGPSLANQGDFSTAGSINMVSRESFEHSSVGVGFGGSPGNGMPMLRALAIASPKFQVPLKATFAAELGQENGPFVSPNAWNRYKLFNRIGYTFEGGSTVSLIHMGYGGDWKGSGQIAARAVEQGIIPRFGTLDPTEGGNSTRHQVALQARLRPSETSELRAMAFVGSYAFNMFSNFTGTLVDPVNGDEIEQVDSRVFYGAKLSYRVTHRFGDVRFDTSVGLDARSDDISNQLWSTKERQRLTVRRANGTKVTTAGAWFNEEISPFSWARLNVGGRIDGTTFSVEDRLPVADATAPYSGVGSAFLVSPKVNLILSPVQTEDVVLDVFINYGHGFHSNDVRGVFSSPTVTPLTRARGGEVGARARLFNRLDLAATGWGLDLANETIWIGDEGTTEVSDPTFRFGTELEARFEITSWLAADLDVTFTRSQFAADGGNGGGLALAPQQTWSGGLSARHQLGPGIARGGVRVFGIGDRPASDDGVLKAPGWTQVDLHLGYRMRWFDVGLDIENLLNGQYRGAQFATTSRLSGEPDVGAPVPAGFSCGSAGRLAPSMDGSFQGCEDVNFTPAYPFTARVTATFFFD